MMTTKRELAPELLEEISAVAESAGCELVHAEFKGGVLRLVLDRPDGITHTDCETVSKQVSALLDVVDFGNQRYVLEVSSPGLDRPLYRPQDYDRFSGRLVKVTFHDPEGGGRRTLVARLEGYRRGEAGDEVDLTDQDTGGRYIIPLKNIELARLEPEI
jgi:ribosome maturation factor RimP